jgi:formylglycine-generating enzyme required for sulfatase activity
MRLVGDLRRDIPLEEDEIFIDLHSLHPGAQFMHQIQIALSKHPIFVVALTPRSVRSNFVRSETNFAIQRAIGDPETYLVIPVMLEACDPTELAPFLMQFQLIDMSRDREQGYQSLVTVIRSFREGRAAPTVAPAPEQTEIRSRLQRAREMLAKAQQALDEGDYESARTWAKEGLKLPGFANDVSFQTIIARSYLGEKRWLEATTILQRLNEIASLDPELWRLRASAQEGLGEREDAIRSLERALTYEFDDERRADILLARRKLQIDIGDVEGALGTIQEELKLSGNDPALRAIYYSIVRQLPRPRLEEELARLRRRNPSVQDLEFIAVMQDEILPKDTATLEKEKILALIRQRDLQADAEQLRRRLNLPSRSALPWEGRAEREATISRLQTLGFHAHRDGDIVYIEPPTHPIDAGPFTMGSSTVEEPQAFGEEEPAHTVTIERAFRIGQFPVTVAEYAAFVRMGGPVPRTQARIVPGVGWVTVGWDAQLDRLDHPVVCVQWEQAMAYSRWLSNVSGKRWRLPTEAEWEKTARWDPARKVSYTYPWGDHWDPRNANTRSGRRWVGATTPIDRYPKGISSYEIWDMAGNVWEWTTSIFLPYPYPDNQVEREDVSPRRHGERLRVLRGGAWLLKPRVARCACRNDDNEHAFVGYFFDVGFRLALDEDGA